MNRDTSTMPRSALTHLRLRGSVDVRRSFTRLAAALCAVVALLGVSAANAPAHAAGPYIKCQTLEKSVFGKVEVCVTFESGSDADVTRIEARISQSNPDFGHWELFGPYGHIRSSDGAYWANNSSFSWSGYQDGSSNQLWCARYWDHTIAGPHDWFGPVCVTTPFGAF